MDDALDVTTTLAENVRRARSYGRSRLMVVVSADNCPGCEQLAEQLGQPPLRQLLLESAYVCRLKVGDLYANPPSSIRIGSWTLRSPGFPTSWLWDIDDDGLHFVALALGPLSHHEPEDDISRLLAGTSYRVPEAAGITIRATSPDQDHPLDESNGYWARFSVPLEQLEDSSSQQ
ncbi:MAG TPA: hypothetical protein DIU15_06180 [Deltaproteobacteria bacterium]|nr:hypothetical protein [Deltaproteobacteria bacterium]HCP45607.1 hypothetical protein [Deltaproteobacteria bacterium]